MQREREFIDALRRVGFSRSVCESINEVRKAVFEGREIYYSYTDGRGKMDYETVMKKIKDGDNTWKDFILFDQDKNDEYERGVENRTKEAQELTNERLGDSGRVRRSGYGY